MQTTTENAAGRAARHPHPTGRGAFPPDAERRFQAEYYARVRPTLRLVSLLLAGMVAAQTLLTPGGAAPIDRAVYAPEAAFWLCVFGLTWVAGSGRVWRPTLLLLGWVTAALALGSLGHGLRLPPSLPGAPPHGPNPVTQRFGFALQMAVLMVQLSTMRLPFRWAALLQGGVLAVGLGDFGTNLPPGADLGRDLHFILVPSFVLLLALLLTAYVQERLARTAFWAGELLERANAQLAEERDEERRGRERTESNLRVLGRAIGGIVHDLGNPLTSVQMGAQTLTAYLGDPAPDPDALREFAGTVTDGAEMLNALRLSLMEQVRALEGKPTPLDLRVQPLRPIVEAGARFQSGRLTGGRQVLLCGADREVAADRLKLATVFMNLIGNALKYSGGDVKVAWRAVGDTVLVAVEDRGTGGRGVTEAQARGLFVPFGRLEAHADVEGTGLGLVSARKVVEAHGGELFVEGHADGTPAAAPFSTADGRYPSVLDPGFLTAFVVAWPGIATYGPDDEG